MSSIAAELALKDNRLATGTYGSIYRNKIDRISVLFGPHCAGSCHWHQSRGTLTALTMYLKFSCGQGYF